MVDFIAGIGGGYWDHTRFAISFNIKAYHTDLDVDHLWKMLCSDKMDVGPDPKLPPEHMARAKALFWRVHAEHNERLWQWGCEEAYEGWRDSDTPYETFVGERIEWEYEIHGRSSGHLCMTECAGIDLKRSTEDLEEHLRMQMDDGSWYYTHKQVRALFIICVQNWIDLTPRKVSDEVEYRAAWRLWVSFCEEELKQEIAEYEERESLSESAGEILDILRKNAQEHGATEAAELDEVAAFKAICKLADVKIGE
jgi:hypothetical protein